MGDVVGIRIPQPSKATAVTGTVQSISGDMASVTAQGQAMNARIRESARDAWMRSPDEVACWSLRPQTWPIGAIFLSFDTASPLSTIGYGVWEAVGPPEIIVGAAVKAWKRTA